MKKKFGTKIISILLIMVLAVSLFTGCSKNNSGKNTSKTDDSQTATEETETGSGQVNVYGWEVPKDTMEISFYHTDTLDPDKDARNSQQMADYLLDKFNVKFNRIVYDSDAKQRLNLMLASGDYPEVIVGMDEETLDIWKAQGKIQEISSYVDQYGAAIKERMGDNYARYQDSDGKLYGIPRGWGYSPISDYSAAIRWDWYQEMGAPKIETPQDYYNVLSQMVAAHPENSAGEKVYAMSWNQTSAGNFLDSINAYLGVWGLKDGYKEDAEHNLTHWVNTDEGLEAVKYLNQYTVAGLMDPDAFINTFEDWKQKFSSERILGNINGWWQVWNAGHETWQKTWDNWTDDQRFVQIALKAPGAEKAYMSGKDTWGWNYTVITDKCKDPENVMKWLNFTLTPMGEKLIDWGVPNEDGKSVWHFNGGTDWSWDEAQKQKLIDGTFNYDDYDALGNRKFAFIESTELMPDGNNMWYDQNFNDEIKWKKVIQDNLKDVVFDDTAFKRVKFKADNPLSVTKQQIDDVIVTGFAKCVMSATEEECVANFKDLRDSLNKAGLHDIEDYLSTNYKDTLTQWGEK